MMSFLSRYWSGKSGTTVEQIKKLAEEELGNFTKNDSDGKLKHRIIITYENTPDN